MTSFRQFLQDDTQDGKAAAAITSPRDANAQIATAAHHRAPFFALTYPSGNVAESSPEFEPIEYWKGAYRTAKQRISFEKRLYSTVALSHPSPYIPEEERESAEEISWPDKK